MKQVSIQDLKAGLSAAVAAALAEGRRTALWFHAETRIARFVTLDGSEDHAAKELGLPV